VNHEPNQPKESVQKRTLWLFFLGTLGATSLLALNLASVRSTKIFHADLITPFMIGKGLLADRYAITSWNLPDAPYLFPDTLISFLLMATLGSYQLAAVASVAVNASLFIAITIAIARETKTTDGWPIVLASIIFLHMILAAYAPNTYEMLMTPQLRTYIHSGAFLSSGVAWVLLLRSLHANGIYVQIAIFIISALSYSSDALFLVQLVLPATLTIALLSVVRSQGSISAMLKLIVPLWLGVVCGKILTLVLNLDGPRISITTESVSVSWRAIFQYVTATAEAEPIAIITFALIALLFVLTLSTRRAFWMNFRQGEPAEVFAVGVTAAFLINIIAVAATGKFSGGQSLKYLASVHWLIIPALWYGQLYSGKALTLRRPLAASVAALALIGSTGSASQTVQYRNPIVECSISVAAGAGAKLAVGDYWSAKPVTAFTRGILTVLPVDSDGDPYLWASSPADFSSAWRKHGDSPVLVLLNWLDRSTLTNRSMRISDVGSCGGFRFGLTERYTISPVSLSREK